MLLRIWSDYAFIFFKPVPAVENQFPLIDLDQLQNTFELHTSLYQKNQIWELALLWSQKNPAR